MENFNQKHERSEEEIISGLITSVKEQFAKGITPIILIEDTIGGGPSDKSSVEKVEDIAEKLKAKLADEGISITMDRDPVDFREYFIDQA